MICLYSRIFFTIRAHARKATAAAAARKRAVSAATTVVKDAADPNDKLRDPPRAPEAVSKQADGITVVAVDMAGGGTTKARKDPAVDDVDGDNKCQMNVDVGASSPTAGQFIYGV